MAARLLSGASSQRQLQPPRRLRRRSPSSDELDELLELELDELFELEFEELLELELDDELPAVMIEPGSPARIRFSCEPSAE